HGPAEPPPHDRRRPGHLPGGLPRRPRPSRRARADRRTHQPPRRARSRLPALPHPHLTHRHRHRPPPHPQRRPRRPPAGRPRVPAPPTAPPGGWLSRQFLTVLSPYFPYGRCELTPIGGP